MDNESAQAQPDFAVFFLGVNTSTITLCGDLQGVCVKGTFGRLCTEHPAGTR